MARTERQGIAEAGLTGVLQFMRLLWALDHGLQAASKRMQRRLGVTGPQRLVVRVVGCMPGASAGAVAAVLHLHPSTLTGVIGRLRRDGLLSCRPDPTDRRRTLLRLTAAGRRVDRLRAGTVESAVRAAVEASSPREQRAASAVLARIAEALDAMAAPGARAPGPRRARDARTASDR
jgi:MarR family transcriptional regulator, organic hydroperoxide resistance regulator